MTDLQFEKLCRTIADTEFSEHLTLEQRMLVAICQQMLQAYQRGEIHVMLETE